VLTRSQPPLISYVTWRRVVLGAGVGAVFGAVLGAFLLLTSALQASSGAMPARRVLVESLWHACEQLVPWLVLWLIALPALLRVRIAQPWLALVLYTALGVVFVPRVLDASELSTSQLIGIGIFAMVTGLPIVRAADVWLSASFVAGLHFVTVSLIGLPFGGGGGYGVFDSRLNGDVLLTGGRIGPVFGVFGMLGLIWVAATLLRHQRAVFAGAGAASRSRRDALGDFGLGLALSAACVSLAFIATLVTRQSRIDGFVPSIDAIATPAMSMLGAAIARECLFAYVLISVIALIVRVRWIAVLIATSVAVGVHLTAPGTSALTAAGVGASSLAAGAAFIATGRLWMPVALAFGWMLFEGPIFGFASGGLPVSHPWFRQEILRYTTWSGGILGPDASVLGIIAKLIMAGAVVAFARRDTT
jgi:membrane protease YdiL (CAAX protease family)